MRMVRYVIMVKSEGARRLERKLGTVRSTMIIGPPGSGELVMDLVAITSDEYAPIMARHASRPMRHFPDPSPRVVHYLNLDPFDGDENFARCCGFDYRSLLIQGGFVTSTASEATCRGRQGDGYWCNGHVLP